MTEIKFKLHVMNNQQTVTKYIPRRHAQRLLPASFRFMPDEMVKRAYMWTIPPRCSMDVVNRDIAWIHHNVPKWQDLLLSGKQVRAHLLEKSCFVDTGGISADTKR